MPLHVSNHPLVADSLAGLRDTSTPPEEFRTLARKLITMLLYEATADLLTQRIQLHEKTAWMLRSLLERP